MGGIGSGKFRPVNFNAISKYRPSEFLWPKDERDNTIYDEDGGYTIAQGWGAIDKLWYAIRKCGQSGDYRGMLQAAMRIQKISRKMGIAVVPFDNLGLELQEGELDATVPHIEEELVVLADEVKRRACIYEIEHDEIGDNEDKEDDYSEEALEEAYTRRACVYEVRKDEEEKRRHCTYELK